MLLRSAITNHFQSAIGLSEKSVHDCGDYKAHRIRALVLRVKSRLDRTRYRLLARDWSMTQLLIGRTVVGSCMGMHAALVDWPPRRKDAR